MPQAPVLTLFDSPDAASTILMEEYILDGKWAVDYI